ncbi:MAG: potassium transporter TrkH [Lachnospiraceae bacterium]|nr:potassium transporter TrkH [Lachnospiraceae bacterium]
MRKIRISPIQLIPLSFLLLIVVGTGLLSLPFAAAKGESAGFLTSLFTATTSVCVTGLVVVDTYAHWSIFGQFVILTLIQIGGLGVVAVASMIMLIGKKKFSLGDRVLLGDSLNVPKNRGLLTFLTRVFKSVFIVEVIGAVLFTFKFIPRFGFGKGLWVSLFQSVSAFCNAGMDLIGPGSLLEYSDSPYVMIVTMVLIILGGLGFVVWFDLFDGVKESIGRRYSLPRYFKRLSEHTKLVLIITTTLILFGTIGVLAAEYNNPATLGNMGPGYKVLNSLFQSVTFRTAGFASIPQEGLTDVSCVIGYILMFIGGSPVGTAGGIKTVTAVLFFLNALSYIRGKDETVVFHRRVSENMMRKAAAVVLVSLVTVFVVLMLLMFESGLSLKDAAYETVSALGTVGLSRGITPTLDSLGRIIIIIAMYLGRIGPISMAIFFTNENKTENMIKHSEGQFYVG